MVARLSLGCNLASNLLVLARRCRSSFLFLPRAASPAFWMDTAAWTASTGATFHPLLPRDMPSRDIAPEVRPPQRRAHRPGAVIVTTACRTVLHASRPTSHGRHDARSQVKPVAEGAAGTQPRPAALAETSVVGPARPALARRSARRPPATRFLPGRPQGSEERRDHRAGRPPPSNTVDDGGFIILSACVAVVECRARESVCWGERRRRWTGREREIEGIYTTEWWSCQSGLLRLE